MLPGMSDPSTASLLARLSVVEARVREAVAHRRARGAQTADPFRGLYLSDDDVDGLLSRPRPAAAGTGLPVEADADRAPEEHGRTPALRRLPRTFGLLPLDVDLLVVALAPDLDPRFERLYGYLHDDVTRRRASIGLALELTGQAETSVPARARLAPGAPLVDAGLVEVTDTERPYLTRALRVPDRVTRHLLGDDTPDPLLTGLLAAPVLCPAGDPAALGATIERGAMLCYLHGRRGGGAVPLAAAAFRELGRPVVVLDLTRAGTRDPLALAAAARREARLLGAGLVAGPVDALDPAAVSAFCDPSWPVVLYGRRSWDPVWSTQVPLCIESPTADTTGLWPALLDGEVEAGLDVAVAVGTANLDPYQVQRAATAARWQAVHAGHRIGREELRLGTRAQNAAGLERLARRIEPCVGWPDLVLPPRPLQLLRELATRARTQHLVLDEWGMRQGGGRGSGISALFAGPSGTGKTMAAEVIAYELGFDLYTVDLATVVDKYIGETEKNLDRIFSEAERVNGVLFFDEADALFGKRSDVKDAHDRYANVETAFLLQRMETFDGVAILATNLRANLDDAFTRRLDALVDFPAPDPEYRRRIWELALRPGLPRAADVDLDLLAERFQLTGGNIRSIALAAAYFAAEEVRPVCMADLMRATHREFLKLGRLYHATDFTPYEAVLA
jgi:winged helix domain-containing protein/ATPase family protein associated with various cellular activities (AAA)